MFIGSSFSASAAPTTEPFHKKKYGGAPTIESAGGEFSGWHCEQARTCEVASASEIPEEQPKGERGRMRGRDGGTVTVGGCGQDSQWSGNAQTPICISVCSNSCIAVPNK